MTSEPRMNVALRLRGEGFAPESVTREVGISPTKTWRVGDLLEKTAATRKDDGWVFALPYRHTYDMEGLLEELLNAIDPYKNRIIEVANRFALHREVSFGVYIIGQETPACWFAADTLRRLAELGAGLDIDLIFTE